MDRSKELEQFTKDNFKNVRYIEVFTVNGKKYNFFFTLNNEKDKKFVAFDYVDGKKICKKYSSDKRMNEFAKLLIKEKDIKTFHIQAVFD